MYLKQLRLSNFKNIPEEVLSFSPKLNCFVGGNGEGKTNLLDAIYYLSFCKSYFNAIDTQVIRHGEEGFILHGRYSRNGDREDEVSCQLGRSLRKQFRFNAREYDRLADHIGRIPLVMISPYDRDLINEGSEVRRRYVDSVISQFDPRYLDELITYNKALGHRNALLRRFAESRTFNEESLMLWDRQMSGPSAYIHDQRKAFLQGYITLFASYFELISGGREEVRIEYESQLADNGQDDLFLESRQRDLSLRFTSTGIHKDDFNFLIDGFPAKKFGSQGQQKSFAVALKLAQFDYIRQLTGARPLLLLDDVFDKLDDRRVEQLIHLVSDQR
ncbi:MAG TPA: DNA replication and repair protein RecF, partial [Bacteroidales bacterium]|nr:DNA replication and repair protein RecF [Bacteroidales bacterium]